ncbi:pilin [Uliginosibacterium gangwonense]|uniref:pilin n=1 Tax=Uliginosibacterium gangwonense TaxID=392736 RepID=UPI000369E62E|nr:pilin [Uliginosibacterium gangwonense]
MALGALLYLILRPMYCDYTDRARLAEIIVLSSSAKDEVAQALLAAPGKPVSLNAEQFLPAVMKIHSSSGDLIELAYRNITSKGEIQIFSPQLGVMLVLTPHLAGKEVSWTCWGSPTSNVPAMCRGEQLSAAP